MKKVLFYLVALLLVMSLILIPLAMVPMGGANPPPVDEGVAQLVIPAPATAIDVPAVAQQTESNAGALRILLAVDLLLVVAAIVVIRKKPTLIRLVSRALDGYVHAASSTGGASQRGIMNCPIAWAGG